MPRTVADISMSLDGFVTGPDPDLEHGLGRGGEPLHLWAVEPDDVDDQVLGEATESSGAVVLGRRLFDFVDGANGWTDEMGYGASHAGRPAFFVVTHSEPESVRLGLDFTFVTDGIEATLERAQSAAGAKDVVVMGGADVVRQCVDAGLVDELRLHLAPIVLGGGRPLFLGASRRQLVQRSVQASAHATHITYGLVG